jgi:hypothetical protein
MQRTCTNLGPCPRCGGKLEFRQTVERREKGDDVHFFQCKDCGHIDTRDNNERFSAPARSDYFLFIAEDGSKPNRWSWEIRRKSKPMGAKVSETGFQSRQAAEFSGGRALSDFLIELSREEKRLYDAHKK